MMGGWGLGRRLRLRLGWWFLAPLLSRTEAEYLRRLDNSPTSEAAWLHLGSLVCIYRMEDEIACA